MKPVRFDPRDVDFFVHPIPLTAVAMMALNDHWLKYQFPGLVTGKLSDFCGVFYFPIFLLALFAVVSRAFFGEKHIRQPISKPIVLLAILVTDFLMTIVKLSAPSARLIEQIFADHLFRIHLTQDWTDLVACLVNPLTYLYLRPYVLERQMITDSTSRKRPDI